MDSNTIILLLSIFVCLPTGGVLGCTGWSYGQCFYNAEIQNFKFDAPHVKWIEKDAYPPTDYTVSSLAKLCGKIPAFFQCISEFILDCKLPAQTAIEGLQDSYAFLCEVGPEELEKNQKCFTENKSELQTKSGECLKTYKAKTEEITGAYEGRAGDEELCMESKTFLKCMEDVMLETCGEEPAEFIRNYKTYAIRPFMSDIQCTVSKSKWLSAEKIGIGVGIFLLVIVIGAVLCTMCCSN